MTTMAEPIYGIDLDEELLLHLADPESWVYIQGEEGVAELIVDDFVADVYEWQHRHIRQYHKPATAAALADKFDLELRPPEVTIGDLIDRLRERYARNTGRKAVEEVIKLQRSDPIAVPQLMLRKGRELNSLLTSRGEIFGTGDVDRAEHRYHLRVSRGPGASFGHKALNDYFYGMSGLTFWIAPPKTYKSWQMLQAQVDNAIQGRCAWLYSLELPTEESDMRLRCMLADVAWWHYLRHCITEPEWARIREASALIDESGIYKIAKPPAGKRGIDDMVHTARDAGADVIFFDQLQYIESHTGQSLGSLNQTGEYWDVLNRARDLSDEGPLCIAHQFNRTAMFSDSMPQVEQAKGSSALEETATLALGMWANKDMRRSGLVEVGTLIARNHMYAAWEMQVELSRGCHFEIVRRVEDDDG